MTNLRQPHFHFSLTWWIEDTWKISYVLNHRITIFLKERNLSTNVRVYNVSTRDFIQWCMTSYVINLDTLFELHTLLTGRKCRWYNNQHYPRNLPKLNPKSLKSQRLLFLTSLNLLFPLYSYKTAWLGNHNRLWAFWRNLICYVRISRILTNCGNSKLCSLKGV